MDMGRKVADLGKRFDTRHSQGLRITRAFQVKLCEERMWKDKKTLFGERGGARLS